MCKVTKLLHRYLGGFKLAPEFSEDEVEHYLLPVEDVICSYIVEAPGAAAAGPCGAGFDCLSSWHWRFPCDPVAGEGAHWKTSPVKPHIGPKHAYQGPRICCYLSCRGVDLA